MTGINIQSPWAELLVNGLKTVETRSYHLPEKYIGEPLALIETPGKSGKFKSRIIGVITFSHSFQYPDKESWIEDYCRHKVEDGNILYGWNDKKSKYGWVVSDVVKLESPIQPPQKRGIVFTKNCKI